MEVQICTSDQPIRAESYTEMAWHLATVIVSIGRPVSVSELAGKCSLFRASPEFVEFLCCIPNSPLFVTRNGIVLPSMRFFSAVGEFFGYSSPIAQAQIGVFDAARLFRRGGDVVTYFWKRKEVRSDAIVPLAKKRADVRSIEGNELANARFCSNSSKKIVLDLNSLPVDQPMEDIAFGNTSHLDVTPLRVISDVGLLEYQPNNDDSGHWQITVESDDKSKYGAIDRLWNEYCENDATILQMPETQGEKFIGPILNSLAELSAFLEVDLTDPIDSVVKMDTVSPSCAKVNQHHGKLSIKAGVGCAFDEELIEHEALQTRIDHMAEQLLNDCGFAEERVEREKVPIGSCGVVSLCEDKLGHTTLVTPLAERPTLQEERADKEALTQTVVPAQPESDCQKSQTILPPLPENTCLIDPIRKQQTPSKLQEDKKHDSFPKERRGDQEHLDIALRDKSRQIVRNGAALQERSVHKSLKEQPKTDFPDFQSYIVEEEEGSGGYGTVYRAKRKADGVTFAIKCPHANAPRHHIKNEQRMLERFGGKNFVIKYEGSLKSGDDDCFILEHVEHDRPELLKREIDIYQLQWYGYCLFKALCSLHKQGVFHRDVKPGNFLFSCKTTKGYLIDFNLAKDLYHKPVIMDKSQPGYVTATQHIPASQSKAVSPNKRRKILSGNPSAIKAVANEGANNALPSKTLKKMALDKVKAYDDLRRRNSGTSQGADGSVLTSKDMTSTKSPSTERLREPLPCQGRKELITLAQAAMRSSNLVSASAPGSKRKRVAASPVAMDRKLIYVTPIPLHSFDCPIPGGGSLKNRGEVKPQKDGPCVGTKGFRAPEVLLRSLHQGPKVDVWSAGITLLYLITGKLPFTGDPEQNMKDIVKLKGNEELWEVAKLHNRETSFPTGLLDIRYLKSMTIKDWCVANTKRKDFLDVIPESLLDLIEKCLTVNPRLRITAEEALRHEFFAPCHNDMRKQKMRRLSDDLDPRSNSFGSFHKPVGIPKKQITRPVNL